MRSLNPSGRAPGVFEGETMNRRNLVSLLMILALVATVGACKKAAPVVEPEPVEQAPPPPPPKEPVKEVVEDTFKPVKEKPAPEPSLTMQEIIDGGYLSTVYFDFDRSELSESARGQLKSNADWMKSAMGSKWNVVIEGHCDERGTIEYNLALGERRANAIRDYMQSLGVNRSRMRIVSYGEERPAVRGRGEMAWAKNRRGEFRPEQ